VIFCKEGQKHNLAFPCGGQWAIFEWSYKL
jgi:hypothetical protein